MHREDQSPAGIEHSPKVCLMNDSFPPLIDGVANAVYNYADILTKWGQGAVVVTPSYPNVTDHYPFPVIRYSSMNTTKLVGYRAGYPFERKMLNRLQKENCELIHSHCPVMSTFLARTLRELTDAPVVFTYHTKFDIDVAKAIKLKVLQEPSVKQMIKNIEACDEVWTVSRGAAANLRQLGYQGDVVQMENGVDFAKGRAPRAVCEALRRKLSIPEDMLVFLFVGRMMWYKGIHIILDALRAAASAGLEFRMLFVGGGTDAAEIQKETATLGLTKYCQFEGAVLDRALLAAYYSIADLLLFPSSYDTNGIVVGEAAACALPSVLIRGSCAAERVTDGQNGILIEENAVALTHTLLEIGKRSDQLKTIGEHAMDELYISWEDSVKKAAARYKIVLQNYRSGHTSHRPMRSDAMISKIAEMQELFTRLQSLRESMRDTIIEAWNSDQQK